MSGNQVLFCEGRNTEPTYFAAVKRACSGALIEMETHGGVGVPYTIAQKAVDRARELGHDRRSRRKKNSFEEYDQIWAVFDRDEHPRFDEAVALCKNHGVRVGHSDPCFELWLVLHERDYDQPNDRHRVQAVLKALHPEYDVDGAKTPEGNASPRRAQSFLSAGSSSSEISRMLDSAVGSGIPAQWVRRTRWLIPSSSV